MIGVFDSGLGGLTVCRAIRDTLPGAPLIYFGDTAHAPFGNRSKEEIGALTVLGIQQLASLGATHFVLACNSISVSVAEPLIALAGVETTQVIDMVAPTVSALERCGYTRIIIAATKATIASGVYQERFAPSGVDVVPLPLPELAGAIEQGALPRVLQHIIRDGITRLNVMPDALVLSCTHFPLALDDFATVLSEKKWDIPIIDPASFVAEAVAEAWGTEHENNPSLKFFVSASSTPFTRTVESLFSSHPYTIEVL